jgi:hypothetical protein
MIGPGWGKLYRPLGVNLIAVISVAIIVIIVVTLAVIIIVPGAVVIVSRVVLLIRLVVVGPDIGVGDSVPSTISHVQIERCSAGTATYDRRNSLRQGEGRPGSTTNDPPSVGAGPDVLEEALVLEY